jgi:hypothetical protein
LFGELEHLKINTRLIDEMFASVMGECVTHDLDVMGVPSKLRVIRKTVVLTRVRSLLLFNLIYSCE